MAIDELPQKQARLAVLRQILVEYRLIKKTDLYIEPVPLSMGVSMESISDSQKVIRQHQSLNDLVDEGLIEVQDYQSLLGIHISIKDLPALKGICKELSDSIPVEGNLPRIIYSTKTGRGKINGKEFRFNSKSDNRKLFRKLVTSPEHRISRSDGWKITNHRTPLNDAAGISDFSRLVSKLRAGLHDISPDTLVLDKKTVELRADIKLTD